MRKWRPEWCAPHLLIDPGMHHAPVHERGRTEQQMADWLHATVAQQLLAAD